MPNKVADSLLVNYWIEDRTLRLPIDPKQIAQKVGLTVSPLPSERLNLSGEFDRDQIFYNPNEPLVRQRFTIAHELGHFALNHGHAFRDSHGDLSVTSRTPNEVAANKFAAELLMPEVAVRHFVVDKGETDAQVLADRFGVSLVSLRYRLENLGLI